MTIHLRPARAYPPDVLVPGDPGRALLLAQELLVKPLMINHHRGLWGYVGETSQGARLAIQSTGIGGPSAAIVLTELAELGIRRAVRVGTCGALDPRLALGDLVTVGEALARCGTSRALGAEAVVGADPGLASLIAGSVGGSPSRVASTDLFYGAGDDEPAAWRDAGAVAVEMECAALFALGPRLGLEVAAVLAVSDSPPPERARIDDEALAEAAARMGRIAAGALDGRVPSKGPWL